LSFLGSCLLILIVISGLACQKKGPAPADTSTGKAEAPAPAASESSAPQPITVEPQIDKTVVTVNGRAVTEQELAKRVAITMNQFRSKLASLPPQYAAQVQKQVRQQVLDNLVAERLLDEQVVAAGIKITDDDVLAEMTKTGAQQQPPITVDDFKKRVEEQGGNFEEVKAEFRKGMGYRKLMESQWGDKIKVSDEDAKQYYDAHPDDYAVPEQIRASHILVLTEPKDPNADPNQVKAAAKVKAEKLLKQVKDGGDFAAIAKENSECPSAASGGDLGFFPRGKMVKPFEDAAFAMKPNQVSDLVETEFGYHIIKVTDHKDAGAIPFEEANAGISEKLSTDKRNTTTRQYIQSLKDKAAIVYAAGEGPAASAPATTAPASQPAVSPATPAPTAEPNAAKP
jgi:peptidyl-prolyl cis-trans isomerase C